jgi:hypothetical protein
MAVLKKHKEIMAQLADPRKLKDDEAEKLMAECVPIVFFAIHPMWRYQTFGSFCLLFNAALNYQNLEAGRPKPAVATEK